MSEKDKNGNDQLSDFLRYRENKMTNKERNTFERKLQKDLFAGEASEGLEGIDPQAAERDIQQLRKLLKKRATGKQRVLWYRIAASIAVLMILSSIFIIINKKQPTEQIAYSPAPAAAPSEETEAAPEQKEAPQITEIKEAVPASPEKSRQMPEAIHESESKSAKKDELKKEAISKEVISYDNQEAIMVAKAEEPEKAIIEGRAMVAKSVSAKGTRYVEYEKADTVEGYTPPRPVNGRDDFDKYIIDNIRRPDTATNGQRVVVVLNLIVSANGSIDSIKVLRSPGKIFSSEAIRLIKEGPAWKPAEKNGKAISDKVRIRIIFE